MICKHGMRRPGRATVTLEPRACMVIIKDVPADVCENCGEYYLSQTVTGELLCRAEAAVRNGAEVEILAYAA